MPTTYNELRLPWLPAAPEWQIRNVAAAFGLRSDDRLDRVRGRIHTLILNQANLDDPLPAAVTAALALPPPVVPPVNRARNALGVLLSAFIASQVVADLAAIIGIILPLNEDATNYIVSFALGYTIFADVIVIVGAALGFPAAVSGMHRRLAAYVSVFAGALGALGLVMLWTPMGLGETGILLPIFILLIVITISDIVSSWLVVAHVD